MDAHRRTLPSPFPMDPSQDPQPVPDREGDRLVLPVEDNPVYQRLIRDQLSQAGIDTLPAVSTGPEAIAMVRQADPAVLLLDIDLEGDMNGIEVAREVAKVSTALMVFVSGHRNDQLVAEAKTTFPYAYLTKPADPRHLATLIQGAFRYRECLRSAAEMDATPASVDEMIVICAWCRAVKARDGWIPLAEALLTDAVRRISHGVCRTCAREVLKAEGMA